MAIAPAKRRIHEHRPAPRLHQAIVLLRVDLTRWHPMARTRRSWVEIEDQPERIENRFRGVPFVARPDARLMLGHASLRRGPPIGALVAGFQLIERRSVLRIIEHQRRAATW